MPEFRQRSIQQQQQCVQSSAAQLTERHNGKVRSAGVDVEGSISKSPGRVRTRVDCLDFALGFRVLFRGLVEDIGFRVDVRSFFSVTCRALSTGFEFVVQIREAERSSIASVVVVAI